MKQTVVPTKWETVFHLYLWGAILTLGTVTLLDFIGLLSVTAALHFTTFGEEQIAGCMPFIALGCWFLSGIIGYCMHKRHLSKSRYDFSAGKIRLACIVTQSYSAILYFVIIAVF